MSRSSAGTRSRTGKAWSRTVGRDAVERPGVVVPAAAEGVADGDGEPVAVEVSAAGVGPWPPPASWSVTGSETDDDPKAVVAGTGSCRRPRTAQPTSTRLASVTTTATRLTR